MFGISLRDTWVLCPRHSFGSVVFAAAAAAAVAAVVAAVAAAAAVGVVVVVAFRTAGHRV